MGIVFSKAYALETVSDVMSTKCQRCVETVPSCGAVIKPHRTSNWKVSVRQEPRPTGSRRRLLRDFHGQHGAGGAVAALFVPNTSEP